MNHRDYFVRVEEMYSVRGMHARTLDGEDLIDGGTAVVLTRKLRMLNSVVWLGHSLKMLRSKVAGSMMTAPSVSRGPALGHELVGKARRDAPHPDRLFYDDFMGYLLPVLRFAVDACLTFPAVTRLTA